MKNTAVTFYVHRPRLGEISLGEINQLPNGLISVDIGNYPVNASLLFEDVYAAKKFARNLYTAVRNLGKEPEELSETDRINADGMRGFEPRQES